MISKTEGLHYKSEKDKKIKDKIKKKDELNVNMDVFDEDINFNDEEEEDEENENSVEEEEEEKEENNETKTDIYGRTIDEKPEKYVPPHLRQRSDNEKQKLLTLRKTINSSLNKVGDENLLLTIKTIINIYNSNPHTDVNMVLTDIILAGIGNDIKVMDSLVRLYTAVIAGATYVFGSSVIGYYLERMYGEFNTIYTKTVNEQIMSEDPDFVYNKKTSNYLLSIVYLYELQCINCHLIFDIIKRLIKSFSPLDLELLLLTLKSCGFQLRSDDPESLKYIIIDVKDKAKEIDVENNKEMSVKSKMMLDMIIDLKNNRQRTTYINEVERMNSIKKQIKSVSKNSNYVALNIGSDDLINVDTKGRWWIMGAQWKPDSNSANTITDNLISSLSKEKKNSLLELAKKMRMNTDIRRGIFVIIMGSEDYLNAFEQLQKLNLNNVQQREVIHILLDCCGQEKQYNPYYAFLAQHLCSFNHSYKFTIQLSYWDFFKEIDNFPVRKIANYAKLLSHLLLKFTLSFGILKTLQFSNLSKQTKMFLVVLLKDFLNQASKEVIGQSVTRLAVGLDNSVVRNGLLVFLHTFKDVAKTYPEIYDKYKLMKKLLDEISAFE